MQLNHYNTNFHQRRFPIILVADNVTSPSNIGSLLRLSDAFGVEKLILCGKDVFISRKALKTSRATEKIVDFEIWDDTLEVVSLLKNKEHQIIALEITKTSQPIHNFKFQQDKPMVLVVGDENFGVSEAVLELSDVTIHIDMFGKNSSMNVAQATNIALYEMTKQLL